MPDVLMICAMGFEAAALPGKYRVAVSGVGFQQAGTSAAEAIQRYRPDLVISVGTCGALDPAMEVGQVFYASRILSTVGQFDCVALEGKGVVLYSQDRVATTVADKQALRAKGAAMVDMESAVIARECAKAGIRFGALKAVSDLADEDLPLDFNRYRRADGSFKNTQIAIAGMLKIPSLMRLQRQAKLASRRLGEAIEIAIANVS